MEETYELQCKHCANTFEWDFQPEPDFPTMNDILEYDYEHICPQCGCMVKINESIIRRVK